MSTYFFFDKVFTDIDIFLTKNVQSFIHQIFNQHNNDKKETNKN